MQRSLSLAAALFLSSSTTWAFTTPPKTLNKRQSIPFGERVLRPNLSPPTKDKNATSSPLDIQKDLNSHAVRLVTGDFGVPSLALPASQEDFVKLCHSVIREHQDWFLVGDEDLTLNENAVHLGQDVQFIKFNVLRDGLPVLDASVDFRFKRGKLVQIAVNTLGEATTEEGDADQSALTKLAETFSTDKIHAIGTAWRATPNKKGYTLTKVARYEVDTPDRPLSVEVNTTNGNLFEVKDRFHYVSGTAKAQNYPRWYNETLESQPLARLHVQGASSPETDASGTFEIPEGVTPSANLKGPLVHVKDHGGRHLRLQGAMGTSGWNLSYLRTSQTSPWLDNATAQVMIFQTVNRAIKRASQYIHPQWFDSQLTAHANLNSTCNAHWDGTTINLYIGNNQCANTGLISDVTFHEWGHGLDDHTGGIQDGAFSEGYGDIISLIMTQSPLLGVGFFVSNHAPVRNLEEDKIYPKDSGEVHAEGLIIGSTFWDLFTALRDKYDGDKASEILASYAFQMIFTARTYLDVYNAILVIDDDDQNPRNGTPHQCLINQVFTAHGLATKDESCDFVQAGEITMDDDSGNKVLTPGEGADLNLLATNRRNAPLEGLRGMVSIEGNPGVSVEHDALTWSEIPSGGSAWAEAPARLVVDSGAACGSSFTAKIQLIKDSQERVLRKEFMIGENAGTFSSFTDSTLPKPIQDLKTTIAEIDTRSTDWADDSTVEEATLQFNIHHTYIGDVSVSIVSPDNQETLVHQGQGSADDIIFDKSITALVKGSKAKGIWKIKAKDAWSQDEGTLISVGLNIKPRVFRCQ